MRPGVARCCFAIAAVTGLALVCFSPRKAEGEAPSSLAQAGPIGHDGGTLSGRVTAPAPFQAAQVYAKNTDRNVMYMVYTASGQYRFVDLFPGSYELSVYKNGFSAPPPTKLTVSAGQSATADLALQEGSHLPLLRIQLEYPQNTKVLPYDTVYPPGPGRDLVQHCLDCHGPDWLSTRQFNPAGWSAMVEEMIRKNNVQIPWDFSESERKVLVDYLAKNFGPDSEPRRVAEPDPAVDETVLSKAMYVEYRLPLPPNHSSADASRGESGEAPGAACGDNCGGRRLHDPHIGNDGAVWYADQVGLAIGKVDPRTAKFTDFAIPDKTAVPHGITMDAQGKVWFTSASALGNLDPETGKIKLYKRPNGIRAGGNTPTVDSKGNVWYTGGVSEIGKWDRATDTLSFYKTPSVEPQPYGMVHDKNDHLWFALLARCKVVEFNPQSEQFVEYSPPSSDRPCTIRRLTLDHDGLLWYGLAGEANGYPKVFKMEPATGKSVGYAMPYRFSYPYDIQADPNNDMWITDAGEGGNLVKFDRKTDHFVYYPMPQPTDMPKIEVTRDGAIWYTTRSGDPKIMSIGVLYPDKDKVKTFAAYNQ